jgi:hypothetical protein
MKTPEEVTDSSSAPDLVAAIKYYNGGIEKHLHTSVHMALDQGNRLDWLKAKVPTRSWSTWRDNTGTPRRTDENYRRLAANREIIEEALAAERIKSINDALKLLRKPKAAPKPKLDLSKFTKTFLAASDEERREALRQLGLKKFYECLPREWRQPIHDTVKNLLASKKPKLRIVQSSVPYLGIVDTPTAH